MRRTSSRTGRDGGAPTTSSTGAGSGSLTTSRAAGGARAAAAAGRGRRGTEREPDNRGEKRTACARAWTLGPTRHSDTSRAGVRSPAARSRHLAAAGTSSPGTSISRHARRPAASTSGTFTSGTFISGTFTSGQLDPRLLDARHLHVRRRRAGPRVPCPPVPPGGAGPPGEPPSTASRRGRFPGRSPTGRAGFRAFPRRVPRRRSEPSRTARSRSDPPRPGDAGSLAAVAGLPAEGRAGQSRHQDRDEALGQRGRQSATAARRPPSQLASRGEPVRPRADQATDRLPE